MLSSPFAAPPDLAPDWGWSPAPSCGAALTVAHGIFGAAPDRIPKLPTVSLPAAGSAGADPRYRAQPPRGARAPRPPRGRGRPARIRNAPLSDCFLLHSIEPSGSQYLLNFLVPEQ